MPLYEYHCTFCHESSEILQKISDAPEKTCPHCHKDGLEKQISSTSFQLKGGGWYVTDFKNKPDHKKTAEAKTETPVAETKPAESASTEKKDTPTEK